MANKRVLPFRRVNLKLPPTSHTALSLCVAHRKLLGDEHVTLQSYLHSLIVNDMIDKGFLKRKSSAK